LAGSYYSSTNKINILYNCRHNTKSTIDLHLPLTINNPNHTCQSNSSIWKCSCTMLTSCL